MHDVEHANQVLHYTERAVLLEILQRIEMDATATGIKTWLMVRLATITAPTEAPVLLDAIRACDADPSDFKAWCVARLARVTTSVVPVPEARTIESYLLDSYITAGIKPPDAYAEIIRRVNDAYVKVQGHPV